MALALEGCGDQNYPLPISTPSHSSPLNVALHSRCFHRGGREGGGRWREEEEEEEEEEGEEK